MGAPCPALCLRAGVHLFRSQVKSPAGRAVGCLEPDPMEVFDVPQAVTHGIPRRRVTPKGVMFTYLDTCPRGVGPNEALPRQVWTCPGGWAAGLAVAGSAGQQVPVERWTQLHGQPWLLGPAVWGSL